MPDLSFFTTDGDTLVPTDMALSLWSDDQLHGVAVSGALARAAEQALAATGRTDVRPARFVVDLFRPARKVACTLHTEVVREGRRIVLVDATLSQGGERVARASATFVLPTESPEGAVWSPEAHASPPPLEVAPETDEPHVPFFHSSAGWSQDFGEHQNDGRKASWNSAIPVVAGERPTGFQCAAAVADGASMVTNWGSRGVEYINTDIALVLARQPIGTEIGLAAVDRVEHDGVMAGTAEIFDRVGPLGSVVVTGIANARRTVDFAAVSYDDAGTRTTPGA